MRHSINTGSKGFFDDSFFVWLIVWYGTPTHRCATWRIMVLWRWFWCSWWCDPKSRDHTKGRRVFINREKFSLRPHLGLQAINLAYPHQAKKRRLVMSQSDDVIIGLGFLLGLLRRILNRNRWVHFWPDSPSPSRGFDAKLLLVLIIPKKINYYITFSFLMTSSWHNKPVFPSFARLGRQLYIRQKDVDPFPWKARMFQVWLLKL